VRANAVTMTVSVHAAAEKNPLPYITGTNWHCTKLQTDCNTAAAAVYSYSTKWP